MKRKFLIYVGMLMAVFNLTAATGITGNMAPGDQRLPGILEAPANQPGTTLKLKRVSSDNNSAYTYTCNDAQISFECSFIFDNDAKKVTISNLAGLINSSNGQIQSPNSITASFEDGVISIPCADTQGENATLLGKSNGGDVYLQVGTKDWDDFGIFRVISNPLPDLKLYVSEDFSSIESRLAQGISIGGVYHISDFGWVCFGTCDNNVSFEAQNSGNNTFEYSYTCQDSKIPFECSFTFDPESKKVTISNLAGLFNSSNGQVQSAFAVTGVFENGIINLPCANVGTTENSTLLGKVSSGDLYLQVGQLGFDDLAGIFKVIQNPQQELKLYVSEDYSTIETRLEDGIIMGGVYKMSEFGWVCFGTCDNNVSFNQNILTPPAGSKFDFLYTCDATDPAITFKSRFEFDLDAETVTISNFGGFINQTGSNFVPEIITVPFKNGEFILPCEGLGPNAPNSTKLGVTFDMDAYLQVGTFSWTDDFITMIENPLKELKFKVNEDYSKISAVIDPDITVAGVIDYTDIFGVWACTGRCTGSMVFTRIQETEDWTVNVSSVDFGTTFVSSPVTKTVTLQSNGGADVEWTATADNKVFTVSPSQGTLEALDNINIKITYNPSEAGEHNGILTISGTDLSYDIALSGAARQGDTDFSGIITSGDPTTVEWTNVSATPWIYNNGKAILDASLCEDESVLSLTISGNKPKRLTFDINLNCDFNDTFSMRVNGSDLFGYHKRLVYTESRIVPPGKAVEWVFTPDFWAEGYVEISNLKIEDVDSWEGLSPDGSVNPVAADGYMNVDGKAVASSKNANMMISLDPQQLSNISFDYEAGTSAIEVLLAETLLERIEAGNNGTFHYDFESGSPAFITIKTISTGDDLSAYGKIGNLRFTPGAYTDEAVTYNAVVYSYTDKDGSYSKENGLVYNYPVEVTLTSGGKAIFKGLLPKLEDYVKVFDVEGYVIGDEIHIPTYKNINLATIYAYDETSLENYPVYYDSRYWLVAGEIGNDMIQSKTNDELILKISDDGKVLSPTSDFGIWGTWSWEDQGIISFYRADSQFVMQGTEAEISTTATEVNFGEIMANDYVYKREFTVLSVGTDCEFSALTDSDEFEISPAAGVIKAGATQTFTVSFSTLKPGLRETELTVYSEGNDIVLPLKADVKAIPDYASIVSAGKELITFDPKVEYPWILTDEGARSTNDGINNSESVLKFSFTVPEGKTGVFSLDGAYCFEPIYDSFQIRANNALLYADHYHNESINTTYPLESGDYEIELVHLKDSEDKFWMPFDHSLISDISLKLSDSKVFATYTGDIFPRTVSVGDVVSDVVTLVNKGNSEVSVISIDGTNGFGGVATEAKASKKNDTFEVQITFLADKPGNYEGVVTVHTTAGDVEIPVKATAAYVKYIGAHESDNMVAPYITALLQYGERYVTSTMWYPEAAMEPVKNCNISSLTFFSANLPDYTLTCPQVTAEVGVTDETNITDMFTGLQEVMNGEMVDIECWHHTITFDEPYLYEDGNFVFQLSTAALENYGGHQRVQISYEHSRSLGGICIVSLNGETADYPQKTVPVMMVSYEGKDSGIENTALDLSEIVEIQYYTIDGIRINAPVKGLNVIVTIYSNGERRSSVMMK